MSRGTGMAPVGNRRAPELWRKRRLGNLILLSGNVPMIRIGKHDRVVCGTDLAEFSGGARARLDAER